MNSTREMGGAHARAALNPTKPLDRASDIELAPSGWTDAAASEIGKRPARRRPNQKLVLAIVGVVVGAAGGVGLALYLRNPAVPAPPAIGEAKLTPTPVAAPNPPPVPAPAAPVAAPAAAPTAPSPAPSAPPSPAAPTAETPPVVPEVTTPAKPARSSAHHKPGHARGLVSTTRPGAGTAQPAAPAPPTPASIKQPPPLAPGLKPPPWQQ